MRRSFLYVGPPLLAAGVFLVALTGDFRAQDKQPADNRKLDEVVRSFLLEVTQKGIVLYNKQRDYEGCVRLYGRALLAVESLLSHRPDLQQAITAGVTKAQQAATAWQHAFALREVMDRVRGGLGTPAPPATDKKAPTDAAKPVDKVIPEQKPIDVKKTDALKVEKGPNPNDATISGRVTYKGKPLPSGTVTLVNKGGGTYRAPIKADGNYEFRQVPPGEYRVAIESTKGQGAQVVIPERYQNANTSDLSAKINRGVNLFDLNLQ